MRPFLLVCLANLFAFAGADIESLYPRDYFAPAHRLGGIGVARQEMSDELLAARTDLMIQSQTFGIMRDPDALPGAQRITSPKLQAIFRRAAQRSGLPVGLIEAVSYLESWGNPKAESWAGPKGIMQISEATARRMGLRITRATRYKVSTQKVSAKRKGRIIYRTVRRKTPYTVTVRDERLQPEKAIPAAAVYLSQMEQKFGGRDWAVFAYHCGEGCVGEMLSLTRSAKGMDKHAPTVARMFFGASPVYNRELYDAVYRQMERDYSPTYWFRVMRAEQLLGLYRKDPGAFRALAEQYRSDLIPTPRAPHRLSVWLRTNDLTYRSCEDIRADSRLVKALDKPKFYGYTLRTSGKGAVGGFDLPNQDLYLRASPSALGTLTYIAYETRRLHDAMKPKGEKFQPLEVTSLVAPMDQRQRFGDNGAEFLAHCTGQVFDISFAALPPGERQCLRFVLDDLGWDGYLGFVEEGPENFHIGCAPSARDFFADVFRDAVEAN